MEFYSQEVLEGCLSLTLGPHYIHSGLPGDGAWVYESEELFSEDGHEKAVYLLVIVGITAQVSQETELIVCQAGLAWANFEQFPLWNGTLVLEGMIFVSFQFGSVWWS